MGLKSQFQIKMRQRMKRRSKRRRLSAKGQNSADYFYGKFYIKGRDS